MKRKLQTACALLLLFLFMSCGGKEYRSEEDLSDTMNRWLDTMNVSNSFDIDCGLPPNVTINFNISKTSANIGNKVSAITC